MRGKVARILRKHSAFNPNEERKYIQEEIELGVDNMKMPWGPIYECCDGEDGKTSFNTTRRIYKILKKKYTSKGV